MKQLIVFGPLLILILLVLYVTNNSNNENLPQAARIEVLDPTPTPTPIPKLHIKASIPYWDQQKAFSSVQKYPQAFDEVSVFWYILNPAGNQIFPYKYAKEDENMLVFFKDLSIDVSAVLTNLPEEEGSTW